MPVAGNTSLRVLTSAGFEMADEPGNEFCLPRQLLCTTAAPFFGTIKRIAD
jgi:hypothetical protein